MALSPVSIEVALPARAERALKICSRGRDGVKNNERFARAGKANINGKRPLSLFSTRRNFARGAEFFFVFSN
jgi:hypothetical protein